LPRFYFDTSLHGRVHLDLEGEEYPDAPSAVQAAKFGAAEYIADQIAHGGSPDDEEKLIRTEDGKIIARFRALDMLGEVIPRR
jgi:hypothetical protein